MTYKYKDFGILAFAVLSLCLQGSVQASEFRSFRPILTSAVSGGQGAGGGKVIKPISRTLATKAVDKIIAAWNRNNVNSVLGDEFFDKSRLNDSMNAKVPRDARLEVLAIQDVQTLGQKMVDSSGGKMLVSTVSITVKTQLTFNGSTNGYQRREGTNEYIMRIKQRVP